MNELQEISVLIAEDDQNSAKLLIDFLSAKGVGRIQHAADGIEAIALSRQEHFDIAVVDLRLPGENGFMVTEYIRGLRKPVPTSIIVVSAFFDRQNQLRAFESGANAFFSKPIALKELLLVIRNFALQKQNGLGQTLFLLERLNQLGEAKLGRTGHGARTAELCCELAQEQGLAQPQLTLLLKAAVLHDLCFVYDGAEGASHAEQAAELLQGFHLPTELVTLVRHHHTPDAELPQLSPSLRALLGILRQAERILEA